MNVQIALRNSHHSTGTRPSKTIPRPWVVIAGVVTAIAITLAGGAILQNSATTEQVAAFSAGLTDSVAASAKIPQAGMPDGYWDAETAGPAD